MKTPIPAFTVFCQEAGGTGTIHISSVEASDLESAITVGKQQCIDDWSGGSTPEESRWNEETVHCLGVAAGNIQILHWEDQTEWPPTVMNQPIPRNGTEPLKVGDRVQIVPEWQDPGDEKYERFVIEAPTDCTSVRIQAVVPGLFFQPVEWLEADRLLLLPTNNQ